MKLQMVGFPEFWQTAHDLRPLAFKALKELHPLQQKLFLKPITEPLHKVVRHISKVVMNSQGALNILVLNGYGNDAMKVARSMFEGAVTTSYLVKYPDKLDDFLDYHYVRTKRQLDYIDESEPELARKLPAERRREIEADYAKVAPRFTNRKGRVRNSWSDKSIYEMAKDVGLGDHYSTFYRWASEMQHLDIGGLSSQADQQSFDVDVAPSLQWLETALISGHQAVLTVLYQYNQVSGHGLDQELEEALKAFQQAWKVDE